MTENLSSISITIKCKLAPTPIYGAYLTIKKTQEKYHKLKHYLVKGSNDDVIGLNDPLRQAPYTTG